MADQPDIGAVAQRIYDQLLEGNLADSDAQFGWPLAIYLAGLCGFVQPIDDVVRERDGLPSLGALLDPDEAPTWGLQWLAQFPGVQLPQQLTELQQREAIKQAPAQDRGTESDLVGRARRHLSDPVAGRVTVHEWVGGDPYQLLLITYTPETPDPAAVQRDLPELWGIRLTYRTDSGWDYDQLRAVYAGRTYDDLRVGFATYDDLDANLPL